MPVKRGWFTLILCSPTLYVVAGVLLLGAVLFHWLNSVGGPEVLVESLGGWAPAITVPVHSVLAVTPFPSDLIAVGNGALYGFAWGTLWSCLGWWGGAVSVFAIGNLARKDFDLESNIDRVPKWLRGVPIDHPVFLIGVRQVPWLGMHVGSFLPGAVGVPLKRFLWCSAVGVIPGSVLMTAIGAGLMTLW